MTPLQGVVAFLMGEAPLDGVWFGDRHPTERGAFWWRKHLREALATTHQPSGGTGAGGLESALLWWQGVCSGMEDNVAAGWGAHLTFTQLRQAGQEAIKMAATHPAPQGQDADELLCCGGGGDCGCRGATKRQLDEHLAAQPHPQGEGGAVAWRMFYESRTIPTAWTDINGRIFGWTLAQATAEGNYRIEYAYTRPQPAPSGDFVLVPRDALIEGDSYGVWGSDFIRCKLCGSESGAGMLNKGIQHGEDCPLAAPARAEAQGAVERRYPCDGNGDEDAYNRGWNAALDAAARPLIYGDTTPPRADGLSEADMRLLGECEADALEDAMTEPETVGRLCELIRRLTATQEGRHG